MHNTLFRLKVLFCGIALTSVVVAQGWEKMTVPGKEGDADGYFYQQKVSAYGNNGFVGGIAIAHRNDAITIVVSSTNMRFEVNSLTGGTAAISLRNTDIGSTQDFTGTIDPKSNPQALIIRCKDMGMIEALETDTKFKASIAIGNFRVTSDDVAGNLPTTAKIQLVQEQREQRVIEEERMAEQQRLEEESLRIKTEKEIMEDAHKSFNREGLGFTPRYGANFWEVGNDGFINEKQADAGFGVTVQIQLMDLNMLHIGKSRSFLFLVPELDFAYRWFTAIDDDGKSIEISESAINIPVMLRAVLYDSNYGSGNIFTGIGLYAELGLQLNLPLSTEWKNNTYTTGTKYVNRSTVDIGIPWGIGITQGRRKPYIFYGLRGVTYLNNFDKNGKIGLGGFGLYFGFLI